MRVCVIDDQEVVREGLRHLLSATPPIEISCCAASGAVGLERARAARADVVLAELLLPDMTGDELCRAVHSNCPGAIVVFFSACSREDLPQLLQDALTAGAVGFVSKSSGLDELRRTLLEVARSRGEPARNQAQGDSLRAVEHLPTHAESRSAGADRGLTPRQQRVLELAAQGLTYCEIGATLHVSESTVRFHIQRIKARLGVRNRSELVAVAIRGGLTVTDPYAAIA